MIILNRLQVSHFKQLRSIDLRFPERGTVLIEGHNEAGKSSLFEAVIFALYGRPLLNDRDYKIEALKQYGAEEMEVILDFTVSGRALQIARRFGKRHSAKLILPRGVEGETETITILSEIEKRLLEETRLSFDALLNTCFVEQKRLERLEDLNPNDRQQTIDELLNLKVLTRLQQEFRVGREDKTALEQQKLRTLIAELDEAWPRLQAEVTQAECCQLWARWRELERESEETDTQISKARINEQRLQEQRNAIEVQLHSVARLRGDLSVLQGESTLGLRVWQDAEIRLQQLQTHVEKLQEQRESLPAREEKIREYTGLAARLKSLEEAEQQALVLEAEAHDAKTALERREILEKELSENDRLIEKLKAEESEAQSTLQAAESTLENRRKKQRRADQLNVWIVRQEKRRNAQDAEAALTERLRAVRQEASKLSEAEKDLSSLQEIEQQLFQLIRSEEALAREAKRQTLQSDHEKAQKTLDEKKSAHTLAERQLQGAEQRIALEAWVKAWQETNQSGGDTPLKKLAIREGEAKQAFENVVSETGKAERTRTSFAWSFLAGILTASGAGFLFGFPLAGGVLALVLAAIGAWLIVKQTREVHQFKEEQTKCSREIDALKGERRALESQKENAAQRQLAEPERVLQSLGLSVPTSAAEAQKHLEKLPSLSQKVAREELVQEERLLHEARVEYELAARALKAFQSTLASTFPDGNSADRATLESQRETASSQLKTLSAKRPEPELHGFLEMEQEERNSRLQKALEAVRRQVEGAQAAKRALSDLGNALDKAQNELRSATRECQESAQVLSLNERDETLQKEEAEAEIKRLRRELESVSETELGEQVSAARSTLSVVQTQLSVATVKQQQQSEQLEKTTRAELHERLEEVRKKQETNESTLEELSAVRSELKVCRLPTTYIELRSTLATHHETLRRLQEEVQQLGTAQQELERGREKVASARNEFTRSWERVSPETPAPSESEAAELAVSQKMRQLQGRLNECDEEALKAQQETLHSSLRQVHDLLATLRHRQNYVQEEIKELQQQLGVREASSDSEEFLQSCPELLCAPERTAQEWEEVVHTRRTAAADNRSERRARASSSLDMELQSGSLLDLTAEKKRLREREEAIAVKQRAEEIVGKTRVSIVQRVMPRTMQNIRRLLPLLTDSRYHDAEWDEEKNWILIHDSQARELVRKRTFSGGARDQISLALRLAFALATLPSELETRPEFLFLDEPLSSFDRERTRALVDLLTRGLIHREFKQIFLISHSESFDSALFDYRLRLENGQITLNTLPT